MIHRIWIALQVTTIFIPDSWPATCRAYNNNNHSVHCIIMDWGRDNRPPFCRRHSMIIELKLLYFPSYWPFVRGIHRSRWVALTKACDAELWYFLRSAPDFQLPLLLSMVWEVFLRFLNKTEQSDAFVMPAALIASPHIIASHEMNKHCLVHCFPMNQVSGRSTETLCVIWYT